MTQAGQTFKEFSDLKRVAKKMQPTSKHRAGIWENMLGTVYAMDPNGNVQYFDYDYKAAAKHVGFVTDVRVARFRAYDTRLGWNGQSDTYTLPRHGQLVWFVKNAGA